MKGGDAVVKHVLLFVELASEGVTLIAGIDDGTHGDVSSTCRLEVAVRWWKMKWWDSQLTITHVSEAKIPAYPVEIKNSIS